MLEVQFEDTCSNLEGTDVVTKQGGCMSFEYVSMCQNKIHGTCRNFSKSVLVILCLGNSTGYDEGPHVILFLEKRASSKTLGLSNTCLHNFMHSIWFNCEFRLSAITRLF